MVNECSSSVLLDCAAANRVKVFRTEIYDIMIIATLLVLSKKCIKSVMLTRFQLN